MKPTNQYHFCVKPYTGNNLGIIPIEHFEESNKGNNIYLVPLQTQGNFLTKYSNVPFGYEVPIEKESVIVTNPSKMNLSNGTFITYDIETTGLSAEFNNVTEIGAVKVTLKNGKIVNKEKFQTFVKQTKPISTFIQKLTHITNEMLEQQGVPLKDALVNFKKFCGDYPCIGHNIINFDSRFLNKHAFKIGLKNPKGNNLPYFDNAQIDTMEISKALNKRPNHKLQTMATQNIKLAYSASTNHRADKDANDNWEVFYQYCIPELKKHGVNDVIDINNLTKDNYIYWSQHSPRYVVIYPNTSYRNKLLKLAQQDKINATDLIEDNKNFICTNNPSSTFLFDSAINDDDNTLCAKLDAFDFIILPPVNFWTNWLGTKTTTRYLDLSDKNDKILYENSQELEKTMYGCSSDEEKIKALAKSPIFSYLSITQTNVKLILSKISFINNNLCDVKHNKKENRVYYTLSQDPGLTKQQLEQMYKKVITACQSLNKKVVIDNEVFVENPSQIEEFEESLKYKEKNPYRSFTNNDIGSKFYSYKLDDIKKQFAFLKDPELIEEICVKNPEKMHKKLKSIALDQAIKK